METFLRSFIKRLSNTGHFLYDVSTNARADPLARQDDVHIEV